VGGGGSGCEEGCVGGLGSCGGWLACVAETSHKTDVQQSTVWGGGGVGVAGQEKVWGGVRKGRG
jgi:hypothetical protein